MTSAPRSPSSMVQYGPARACVRSRTRIPSRGSDAGGGTGSGSGGTRLVRWTGWIANQHAEPAAKLVHVAEFCFPTLQQLADRGTREAANLVQQRLAHDGRHHLGCLVAGGLLRQDSIDQVELDQVDGRELEASRQLVRVLRIVVED